MSLRNVLCAVMVLALSTAMLMTSGCGGEDKPAGRPTPPEPAPKVKASGMLIGVLLPLSGPNKSQGDQVLAGLRHAIAQKGVAIGLGESSLIVKDYGAVVTDIPALARNLIEVEEVCVLVGPIDAKGVEMIEELASQRKAPVLTTAGEPMKLREIGSTVYRVTFSDDQEGAAMASFAEKKRMNAAAVLVDSDMPTSAALAGAFAKAFVAAGAQDPTLIAYSKDDADLRRPVRMAAYAKPDVFYLTGGMAGSTRVIEEMKTQGVFGAIFGSTAWDTTAPFPVAMGPGASVYAPCRFSPDSTRLVTTEFIKAFQLANGRKPTALEAIGYDAGLVIVDALSRAGKQRDQVAREVAAVELLGGVTGTLSAKKWRLAGEVTVLELKDGVFVPAETIKLE